MDLTVPEEAAGQRLDRYLAEALEDVSRTRVQQWIKQGRVLVDEAAVRPSARLQGGESVEVDPAPAEPLNAFPEDIPLRVLYEDEHLAVIDKPAGMTVHAGAGEESRSGTLVNALLHHFGAQLSQAGGALRPGIVHRLDRFTSGAILVAKTDKAHQELARQFENREVHKTYLALVHGRLTAEPLKRGRAVKADGRSWVRLESAIGRDPRNRVRMAVLESGKPAVTDYTPLRGDDKHTLLEVRIHTGRTHQIRVHLSWIGRPIVGDRLYGAPESKLERFFLHAWKLRLRHPATGAPLEIEAPLAPELDAFLVTLPL
ncbi:MAG: RluA family pseudouridine synthase [Bryobacterales bacterium]|nr:RluA family pseudouridine synthase [Bryobacterales bacterium]